MIAIITLMVRVLGEHATFPWKGSSHKDREFCLFCLCQVPSSGNCPGLHFCINFEIQSELYERALT